jgi:hypothetical protein
VDLNKTVEIKCRYHFTEPSGTTPKFDCTLDDGRRIRVKYGSLELRAEVAATRLLSTLGFGADNVSMARRVRCYGCPPWPMLVGQVADRLHLGKTLAERVNFDHHRDFEWVSVEWRDHLNEMTFGDQEGWSWYELSTIDPTVGGASRSEVDAFRLMAMFLNHWDNKASNHRLACPLARQERPTDSDKPVTCDHPLALMHDVGSTFGPKKMNLEAWSQSPIWADEENCALSMKHLPYEGGTFEDVTISEEGRRVLADRLTKLSDAQVKALFSEARFENVDGWAASFERRVNAIAHRPPCPSRI